MRRVLLTVLGINPRSTRYSLAGRVDDEDAMVCPVALVRLLEPERRPSIVFAVVTPASRGQSFDLLVQGMQTIDRSIVVRPIDVPDPADDSVTGGILEKIAGVFEPHDALTLDVTHGYRHMPFLMYAVSLYVTALQGVEIEGAYYGALGTAGNPILDLRPLLELPHWFQAVEEFRDSGDASRIARLVRERHGRRIPGREYPATLRPLADQLSKGSAALAAGLPIEAGLSAAAALARINSGDLTDALHDVPLAASLESLVKGHLESLAVPREVARQKQDLRLDAAELDRQLGMIDVLVQAGDPAGAASNLREWFVSWMIWRERRDTTILAQEWLDKQARFAVEQRLGRLAAGLARPAVKRCLDGNQQRFAEAWDACLNIRNAVAHCGMKLDVVAIDEKKVANLLEFARDILHSPPALPADVEVS